MYQITPAAYILTHVYLNTMQQGIQSLHVVGELFAQHREHPGLSDIVYDWATNHKVVRILNGGGGPDYMESIDILQNLAASQNLPFAVFQEPDIFDIPTAFGVIVTPQVCYDSEVAADGVSEAESRQLGWEHPHALTEFLSQFGIAR